MRLPFALLLVALTLACARGSEPRVIFLGLDGADFRLLDRYTSDGTMPRLAKLLERAETRVLMTQHPPLSPLLWTSMMTGVSPLRHRILDFTRFNPATRQQEPITSDERAVPAIWNKVQASGKRAAVFGLWATYPAEEGVVLTDRDLPRDYARATELVHARASAYIRKERPHLAIVYIQGTDEIGHFTSGDVEKARPYFRRIDEIVGDYQQLADDLGAQLVIASDHGFDWGGKHDDSSTATATAAKWHRDEGVWIHWPREPKRLETRPVASVHDALLELLAIPRDATAARATRKPAATSPAQAATPSAEQVAKLRSLGYLGPAPANATSTRTPQSFNNEGLILRAEGRIDSAESAFRAALELQPDYASARHNLDDLLSARGTEWLKQHDCRGALADFRAVTRESALLFTGIAAAEGCLGNEAAAREAFERAATLDPELRRRIAP